MYKMYSVEPKVSVFMPGTYLNMDNVSPKNAIGPSVLFPKVALIAYQTFTQDINE